MPPPFFLYIRIMKYVSKKSFLLLTIALSLVSCTGNKKNDKIDETYIRPASVVFSKQDTSSIDSLVKIFVQYANNRDMSNVSSMLHVVDNGKINDLLL